MTLRLPPLVLVFLLVAATALLIALGIWQLQRNNWKNSLLDERDQRTSAAPLSFAAAETVDLELLDYRRIADNALWDHDRSFILANRARFGTKGEERVTPLLLAPDGPAVLVNRGWYPEGKREVARERLSTRPAVIEGLISIDTRPGKQVDSGAWTALDPEAMSAELPYTVLSWVVVEGQLVSAKSPPDSGVLPVQRYVAFRNTTPHIEYAMTWFGLAISLIAIAVLRFKPLLNKHHKEQ